jgi:hypothetical protein
MWTPGSRPVVACAEAAKQLVASTAKALATGTTTARTALRLAAWINAALQLDRRLVSALSNCGG